MARARRFLQRVGAVAIGLAAAASGSGVVIYTVTNTNDGGAGSFRQAILDANGTPGSDLIQFAIPGAGVHTIVTFAPLAVTESVLIDGYSQPGSVWNTDPLGDNAVLQVELLGQGTDGLVITGGATIVQGLALYGFQTAIAISGPPGVTVQGNFIGTDAAGNDTFLGNVTGVSVSGSGGPDKIGDNYPAARNVIAGNSSIGVLISACTGMKIQGNLIGVSPNGLTAMPNGIGVQLADSSGIEVGGANPENGNVISGNSVNGVLISNGDGHLIQHNFIGTDGTGAVPLPNGLGVRVQDIALFDNILDNVVSGNLGDGLSFSYFVSNPNIAQIIVAGNFIGTNLAGTSIGNGGAGVRSEGAPGLRINGNTIAFNRVGIWRVGASGFETVTFHANSIHSHHGLGIVIGGAEAIGPNSPGSILNYPLITSVVSAGGTTTIEGVYNGRANSLTAVELFANPACAGTWPQEFDEGRTYIGSTGSFTTDGNGHATFAVDLPVALDGRARDGHRDRVSTISSLPGAASSRESTPPVSRSDCPSRSTHPPARAGASPRPTSTAPISGRAPWCRSADFRPSSSPSRIRRSSRRPRPSCPTERRTTSRSSTPTARTERSPAAGSPTSPTSRPAIPSTTSS